MRNREKQKKQNGIMMRYLFIGLLCGLLGVCSNVDDCQAAGTAADVITTAASQIGYQEKASEENLDDALANPGTANYTKYARDLGMPNGQAWCGYFVWWCMKTAAVPEGCYPNVGSVAGGKNWFVSRGIWHDRGTYTPNPGDYIAFGNPLSHCGIVEYVANGRVYTIEGNSSDVVKRKDYALTDTHVAGYGTITYTGIAPPVVSQAPTPTPAPAVTKAPAIPSTDNSNPGAPYPIPTKNLAKGSTGKAVKWVQACLNALLGTNNAVDGIYGSKTVSAVKKFQKKYGLTVDGVVGANTRKKMLELWRKKIIGSGSQVGKGNSSGNKNQVKVPTVSKVSKFRAVSKRKGFQLQWSKKKSVRGYQIQVSTKKNFKSAKTYSCKTVGKKTISGLKSKKNYYIRIRAYKTYKNSKGKTKKAYGAYVTIHKKTK